VNHFEEFTQFIKELQDKITKALEVIEGARGGQKFIEDNWQGEGWLAGGGRTRVIEEGAVIERGGVNISDVSGALSDDLAKSLPGVSPEFRAAGISLVIHPRNPHAPTVHANFRMIRRGPEENPEKIWFGGGSDLTPMYLYREDAIHFHEQWKRVCAEFSDVASYQKMKSDCDRYFYLPHRRESRGIGGIFYDYVHESPDRMLAFSKAAGSTFLEAYLPILEKRAAQVWTEDQREFQLWRRGRYVEFNLVFDRGTQFGLKTGGRIESILMSLPPLVRYKYNFIPAPGSLEADTLAALKNPQEWI